MSNKMMSLKRINVLPNANITTKILISDISPGTNLLKGYKATCGMCGLSKIVFSKNDKTCGGVFHEEHKKTNSKGCTGQKGGALECIFESINDTGYFCGGYDPEDHGSSPQFALIFFSNKIIPQDSHEREDFETNIQTKPLKIEAKIIPLPSTRKVTEWCLDVQSFEFVEHKAKIDFSKIHEFDDVPKDDSFFENNFVPEIYGRIIDKKVHALGLISPLKVKLPSGKNIWGCQNIMVAGDPGQSKTALFNGTLEYCKNIYNAKLIAVENSTNRGLIGAVVKNPNTNQYMIKMGQWTLCSGGWVGLDGFGKLSQNDYAEARGLQEERAFQINKAGHVKKECPIRNVSIANLTNNVRDYATKHQASYDISATTSDFKGKFSGADRRRYAHILIQADSDISSEQIDNHLANFNQNDSDKIKAFWSNLREFAWNCPENNFVWEEGVVAYTTKKLSELRSKYPGFTLEYGVLSKGGLWQFLGQLPSVAIIHGSINKSNQVEIRNVHVDWLFDLYCREFIELGLESENSRAEFHNIHANLILAGASTELKDILALLHEYGSQTAIEKSGKMARKTIWRKMNEVISYSVTYEGEERASSLFYCSNEGSGSAEILNNGGIRFIDSDGELPSVMKKDGTFTPFGKILTRKAYDIRKIKKRIVPLVPPNPVPTPNIANSKIYMDNINMDVNIYGSEYSESSETDKNKEIKEEVLHDEDLDVS